MFVLNSPPPQGFMDTIKNNREEFKWHQLPRNSDGDYNVIRKGLDSSWRKTKQHKTKLQKLVMTF